MKNAHPHTAFPESHLRSRRPGRPHPANSLAVYSSDETEFLAAVEAYKAQVGRRFITMIEILDVARFLGYTKQGGQS